MTQRDLTFVDDADGGTHDQPMFPSLLCPHVTIHPRR